MVTALCSTWKEADSVSTKNHFLYCGMNKGFLLLDRVELFVPRVILRKASSTSKETNAIPLCIKMTFFNPQHICMDSLSSP